jgi:CDGSH-type Zn-finger protein
VTEAPTICVTANGPYLVAGGVPLRNQHIVTNEDGESVDWRAGEPLAHSEAYALCRCGRSRNKPFCDGTHKTVAFDGTETASHAPYEKQAKRIAGPTMVLEDAEGLCAFARFCDRHGQIWNLVEKSDDPRAARLVEYEAGHCPSGRLVVKETAKAKTLEPQFEPSIGLVQDTANEISGPLWVRGRIPVTGADGRAYEVRNRVTLCRCGASRNKPFCDGSHASINFDDRA